MSLGWTQSRVARRARVSQASVSRLEAGSIHLTLLVTTRIFGALGMDFSVRSFPGHGVGLRDSGQLDLAEALRQQAHASWRVAFEVPAGEGTGQAADALFDGALAGLHVELESNLVDFQAQLRRGQLKRDALQHRVGHPVAFVLALRDTERNRAAVAAHAAVIRAALPATSREALQAIRRGVPLARDGLLWLRSGSASRGQQARS